MVQKKESKVNIIRDPFLYAILKITEIALTDDKKERLDLVCKIIEELETARLEVYPFQRI